MKNISQVRTVNYGPHGIQLEAFDYDKKLWFTVGTWLGDEHPLFSEPLELIPIEVVASRMGTTTAALWQRRHRDRWPTGFEPVKGVFEGTLRDLFAPEVVDVLKTIVESEAWSRRKVSDKTVQTTAVNLIRAGHTDAGVYLLTGENQNASS